MSNNNPSKIDRSRYQFGHHETTDFLYNTSDKVIDSRDILNYKGVDLYQICIHKNPQTKKFQVRRFNVSANNEFTSVKTYSLTEDQIKKLQKGLKDNQYKCYSVYDFHSISYPTMNDILLAQSQMISKDSEYTGYATF